MKNIIDKSELLHISNLKNTKLHGLFAIGTNTTSNPFCILKNKPNSKIKLNKYDKSKNINLDNYIKICKHYKATKFALWSKRKDIIKAYFNKHKKPKNLILIYSNDTINKPIKKPFGYFDKIFNTVSKDKFIKKQNCTGQKCIDCLKCYNFSKSLKNNIIYEAVKGKKLDNGSICKACYSHKAINFRKHTMVTPLEKNSRLLKKPLSKLQIQALNLLQFYFRFNHHGEILDNE